MEPAASCRRLLLEGQMAYRKKYAAWSSVFPRDSCMRASATSKSVTAAEFLLIRRRPGVREDAQCLALVLGVNAATYRLHNLGWAETSRGHSYLN